MAKFGHGAAAPGIEETDKAGDQEGRTGFRSLCRPVPDTASWPDHLLACLSEANIGSSKRFGGRRCRCVLESLWSEKGSVEGELATSSRVEDRHVSVRPR